MAHLVRWLAGLTAAAGVIGCGLALTQRGRVPSSTAPAALSMPTSPIAGFFGINEAISVPSALVFSARISGEQQRAELAADAADTRSLHARTVRANSHTYPFFNHQRFSKAPQRALTRADRYFEVVGEAGLEPVMVIGPWPGIQTANHTDHYLPDDIDSYASFVERIVERYDGDGVDDMPGLLQPVRAWEVDNEPDLHNRVPPRGAKRTVDPSSFETPAEYATVLLATAAAIRRADPQATILTAGIYNIRSASGRAYLEAVLATPGVLDTVDAISLHCYSDEDSLEAVERTIDIGAQVAPGLPIWLTEIAVASDDRKPWVDEDWQAKMVVGIHAVALARGVERVLWHTLADPPARAGKAHEQPFSSQLPAALAAQLLGARAARGHRAPRAQARGHRLCPAGRAPRRGQPQRDRGAPRVGRAAAAGGGGPARLLGGACAAGGCVADRGSPHRCRGPRGSTRHRSRLDRSGMIGSGSTFFGLKPSRNRT